MKYDGVFCGIILLGTLIVRVRFYKEVVPLKKKQRGRGKPRSQFDKHHIFYIRREWTQGDYDRLRSHPYCIVRIHRDTIHKYIHNHLAYIQLPREDAIQEVLSNLDMLREQGVISLDDPIEKRLIVLIALFIYEDAPTAKSLEEQLRLVHDFKKAPK